MNFFLIAMTLEEYSTLLKKRGESSTMVYVNPPETVVIKDICIFNNISMYAKQLNYLEELKDQSSELGRLKDALATLKKSLGEV